MPATPRGHHLTFALPCLALLPMLAAFGASGCQARKATTGPVDGTGAGTGAGTTAATAATTADRLDLAKVAQDLKDDRSAAIKRYVGMTVEVEVEEIGDPEGSAIAIRLFLQPAGTRDSTTRHGVGYTGHFSLGDPRNAPLKTAKAGPFKAVVRGKVSTIEVLPRSTLPHSAIARLDRESKSVVCCRSIVAAGLRTCRVVPPAGSETCRHRSGAIEPLTIESDPQAGMAACGCGVRLAQRLICHGGRVPLLLRYRPPR